MTTDYVSRYYQLECPLTDEESLAFKNFRLEAIRLPDGNYDDDFDENFYDLQSDSKPAELSEYPLWLIFDENQILLQADDTMKKGCYLYHLTLKTFA